MPDTRIRSRVLRTRLALAGVGALLIAALLILGGDAGPRFVLQLGAMLILSGSLAFGLLLGGFRLYEWWADR